MTAVPAKRRWLTAQPYAHRGLHGRGVPENSLAAFDRAVAAGFGIECDVRADRDGTPYVFHDDRLERLTGAAGRFDVVDGKQMAALHLFDGSGIPALAAMLALVAGRVPLLIEVKGGRESPVSLCRAIADQLARYAGPVAVMSFDARVPGWFAGHRRQIPRGLVLSRRDHPPGTAGRRHAMAIRQARPHFLACDVRDLPYRLATEARRRGLPTLCWTVRSDAERRRARLYADQPIFELARRGHD